MPGDVANFLNFKNLRNVPGDVTKIFKGKKFEKRAALLNL